MTSRQKKMLSMNSHFRLTTNDTNNWRHGCITGGNTEGSLTDNSDDFRFLESMKINQQSKF
jgi:hypothetical protein